MSERLIRQTCHSVAPSGILCQVQNTRSYTSGPLRLRSETRDKFALFFEAGPDSIHYILPLSGLVAFSWPALYLELYRSIERLFSFPKLSNLKELLQSPKDIFEISKLLEETLSWRPREDEALELLFRVVDASICNSLAASLRNAGEQVGSSPSLNAATRVYKLRNACVHFRPAIGLPNLTDTKWNDIVSSMLDVIEQLYAAFAGRIPV